MNNSDFRQLEVTLGQLKQTVNLLRQKLDTVDDQVNAIDAEVRINLSTLLEENSYLKFRVDPYANDGSSLVDWDEMSA